MATVRRSNRSTSPPPTNATRLSTRRHGEAAGSPRRDRSRPRGGRSTSIADGEAGVVQQRRENRRIELVTPVGHREGADVGDAQRLGRGRAGRFHSPIVAMTRSAQRPSRSPGGHDSMSITEREGGPTMTDHVADERKGPRAPSRTGALGRRQCGGADARAADQRDPRDLRDPADHRQLRPGLVRAVHAAGRDRRPHPVRRSRHLGVHHELGRGGRRPAVRLDTSAAR